MRLRMLALAVVLGLSCGKNNLVGPDSETPKPTSVFVAKVEVVYHSYVDHNPEQNDWVTFDVDLAKPDGTTRSCTLQSVAVRPYGSDCPDVGDPVEKVGPSTFRAYLYNVWVNTQIQDAKHSISAVEYVRYPSDSLNPLATGNNITIAGAIDEEVKVLGTCTGCVYGHMQARLFRIQSR